MKLPDRLSMDQVDRRVASIRAAAGSCKVSPGWIRYMRDALGMSLRNLAEKTGWAVPTIQQAEKNEFTGAITVRRLRQLAEAMDCDFVYAFVPKSPVREMVEEAARTKARKLLKTADVHMGLEDQRVDRKMEKRIEQLAASLLEKGDIW